MATRECSLDPALLARVDTAMRALQAQGLPASRDAIAHRLHMRGRRSPLRRVADVSACASTGRGLRLVGSCWDWADRCC
jgi:hypothetical protein